MSERGLSGVWAGLLRPGGTGAPSRRSLLHGDQGDVKHEARPWRDAAGGAVAVAQRGRDEELDPAAGGDELQARAEAGEQSVEAERGGRGDGVEDPPIAEATRIGEADGGLRAGARSVA